MKSLCPSDTLPGLLALACAATVVLATALDAQARLGPAAPETAPPKVAPAPAGAAIR